MIHIYERDVSVRWCSDYTFPTHSTNTQDSCKHRGRARPLCTKLKIRFAKGVTFSFESRYVGVCTCIICRFAHDYSSVSLHVECR